MSNSAVLSPVTGGKTDYEQSLDLATVARRYAALGLDVRQFFGDLTQAAIFRCQQTGYRFFHPATLAGESEFYDQLDQIKPAGSDRHEYREWSEDFDYAFKRLVPGERLLDVGCGGGAFLKRASTVTRATGVDGNNFAKQRGRELGIDIRQGRVTDFLDEFAGAFDTVTGFQILEHIYDVAAFVRSLITVTKPGGRLILAVPNNEPFLRRFDPYSPLNCPPHHIGLWNRQSLEKMADAFGLEPTDHAYCEVSGRWTVEAYLHARYLLGIKQEIGEHGLAQKLRMLLLAPYTVPLSLARHWRTGGHGTRNVIAMTFRKT